MSGPPDAGGFWVRCNVAESSDPPSWPVSVNWDFHSEIACNYGPTSMKVKLLTWVQTVNTGAIAFTCGHGNSTDAAAIVEEPRPGSIACIGAYDYSHFAADPVHWTLTTDTAGGCFSYQAQLQIGSATGTAASYNLYSGSSATPTSQVHIESCSVSTSPPVYPDSYYAGGGGGAVADGGGTDGFGSDAPADHDGHEDCGSWFHIACHVRNALYAMFVPDDFGGFVDDITTDITGRFPFNVVTTIVDDATTLFSDLSDGMDDPGTCRFSLLGSGGITFHPPGGDYNFNPSLPIQGLGCTFDTQEAAWSDLGGYRVTLRNIFAVILWLWFLFRIVRTFLPGSEDLAPDPSGDD